MKTALLVIDVQNDYFKGGKMELYKAHKTSEKVAELIEIFRKIKEEVIYIQHISHRAGADFFIKGTEGIKIHKSVEPLETEKIIEKIYPNSYRETELLEYLKSKGIERLVISGMMTHMCVEATVRASFDYGIENYLVGEACTTRDLYLGDEKIEAVNVHKTVLAELNGVYTKVVSVDEVGDIL